MKHEFEVIANVNKQTSYGIIDKESGVKLQVIVGLRDDNPLRGWFELYDIETQGEDWYAEGGLWFNDKKELVDYDGVFSLSSFVIDKLEELGYKKINI
jgi:hypothetical protein